MPVTDDPIVQPNHRSFIGSLLVSPPWMHDPNFERRVVLVLAHTPDGAFGIVINTPSDLSVGDLSDDLRSDWGDLVTEPSRVFIGGPCEVQHVIALADRVRPNPNDQDWAIVFGRIGTVDLARQPIDFPDVRRVRLFAGYSGWGPFQLESELEHDGWFVVEALADDVYTDDPAELWSHVLRRSGRDQATGRDLAAVSYFPPDPTLN